MTERGTIQDTSVSPWTVVEKFRCGLRDRWGPDFKGLIVFGSLARGEWTPESDIDLLVLLDDALDSKSEGKKVWRLAWDLTYQYDVSMEPLVFTEQEYQRGRTPLFFNVRREGMFMEPEDQPSVVQQMMGVAWIDIEEAQLLYDQSYYNGAVSRAYYAMFNAAQAALLSRGITRSRHRGVVSTFGFHFVRTGLVPSQLHQAFEAAYEKRLAADYSPEPVSHQEAEDVLKDAQDLVRTVEQILVNQ